MVVHVFQDNMFFESICCKGGHALWKEMSCARSCVRGVDVFMMGYLVICFVSLEDIPNCMT